MMETSAEDLSKLSKLRGSDWPAVLFFIHIHLLSFYGIWLLFFEAKLLTTLFLVVLTLVPILGVTTGAHRLWAHGTYKAGLELRIVLMIFQTLAGHRYYEFTDDEIKALEECDKESFYQRCLPFSTVFGALTYAAVKTGILKRNPHFGAVPKVMLASFIGYCYGRISYIPQCGVKLRQLPANSYLGNIMRNHHSQNNSSKS